MINNAFQFSVTNWAYINQYTYQNTGELLSFGEFDNQMIDAPTHDFFFKSCLCNSIQNPQDAWGIGLELVSLFNGSTKLYSPNNHFIKLESIVVEQQEYQFPQEYESFSLFYDFFNLNPHLENNCQFSENHYFSKAITNSKDFRIYLLLKLVGFEVNWVTIYKQLETLEHFMHEDGFSSPLSSRLKTSITKPANNFSILGLQARHGFQGEHYENNQETLNLNTASEYMLQAIKPYFNFLLNEITFEECERHYPITR